MRSLYRNKSWLSTLCIWSEASQATLEGGHMCHNGYNHQSWVSSSFSDTAYSCWILFNATALSTEVLGLWYFWWALNLLLWAAFYGYHGMLKSNKWQTGGAIRKAHMFLINQQIDACLEGSLTPARVACQELLFNILFFFNTWSKKLRPSKLCLLSRIGSCYNMQCNVFWKCPNFSVDLSFTHVKVIFLTIGG